MAQPGQGLSLSARGESEFALMQQREHEAMYKQPIEKTLDTLGKRPDSAQAPPKEKNEARSRVQAIRHRLPMVAARDPVMGRRGGACTFTGTVASIQRRRRTLRLKKGLQDSSMAHAATRFMKDSVAARGGGSRRRAQAPAGGGGSEARAA